MEKKKFESFLEEVYQKRLDWYDKKAVRYKRLAYFFNIFIIIFSSIAPISASLVFIFETNLIYKITIIVTFLVLVLTSIRGYCKFEEIWRNYRNIWDEMKREKINYDYRLNEYEESPNPEKLFIERIRDKLAAEHKKWLMTQNLKEKGGR